MIASLSGLVDGIFDGYIVLDVGGVGYRVFCSDKTMAKLSGIRQATKLLIETQVREDHIHLFGFADAIEKQAFELITTVQGVGAKVALAILSALSANDLQMAIMTGDAKAITRANGVGPKLASRIIAELKDKTGTLGTNETMVVLQNSGTTGISSATMDEAISALVNLGYGKSEAGMTVASIIRNNPEIKTAELIRLSLKEIGKGAF